MIDCHVHLGKIRYHRDALTKESLLSWMDNNGIDKVCLMATENPEELHYYVTTNEVLSHKSNRFIPFCNVDPRIGGMKYKIIQYYVDRGAMGFGEVIVGLFIDDPRLVEIYKICGDLHLPILIHTAKQFGEDDDNFTRLQNILVKYPQTNFILHSLRWWRDVIVVENMLSKINNVKDAVKIFDAKNIENKDTRADWTIRDWEKKDVKGLEVIKNETPLIYTEMYNKFYNKK